VLDRDVIESQSANNCKPAAKETTLRRSAPVFTWSLRSNILIID
jgi:hypothetical protein